MPNKMVKKAFTLLELVVVIIIIAVLASLAFTQYTKIIEKARIAEATANLIKMRTFAIAYYMEQGTLATLTNADVGVGSDLPASCVSTNYFWYYVEAQSDTAVYVTAGRCKLGGKTPDWTGPMYYPRIYIHADTGTQEHNCCDRAVGAKVGWCAPGIFVNGDAPVMCFPE